MPWTVFASIDQCRQLRRALPARLPGACHDAVDAVLVHASATLRRRSTDDMADIARLITDAPHCTPCLALVTGHDARRIYGALERLSDEAQVKLVRATCGRCARSTTVYVIER